MNKQRKAALHTRAVAFSDATDPTLTSDILAYAFERGYRAAMRDARKVHAVAVERTVHPGLARQLALDALLEWLRPLR